MADNAANNVTPIGADTQLNDQEKREKLRARIESGERRHEERNLATQAKHAAGNAVDFAKRHPVATIAGAVAVGLAVGAMTRRGRNFGRRGGSMTKTAANAAITYGLSMMNDAGHRIEGFGDTAGTKARRFKRDANYHLDSIGDTMRSTSRKAGRKSSRTMRNLRDRLTR